MSSEQWDTLQDIFIAALQREPSERPVFVRQACRGDALLQAELESLLGSYEEESGFLRAPADAARAPAQQPAAIGHYRILSLVGEGGMGSVYKAEQEQPRRTVALKVIRPGLVRHDTLWRFRRESQALARLQHPGIAQIYEAGAEDSGAGLQPFFAMEFIRGRPLVHYSDESRLNTRQRLELMAKVCEAVHHAHQRGLIHRDLKPGNILVDEGGQPKILDFGVARITDSDVEATQQTDVGQLVGTLAYMSPEQVLADPLALDTRSDVYALGVILYQLLARRMPYHLSPNLHEAARAIQEDDPTPLSSISRSYRGDVETIVAKALEKDKVRRYASAADLATDIHRFLEDKPIIARPSSAIYKLEKFTHRHKGLVTATVVVLVVLVAGIIVSTHQAILARRAEQTAQAVNDFLRNDLLAQASAINQSGLSTSLNPHLEVRTALDRASVRIAGKFNQQPEVEASIRDTIGQTYKDLGQYSDAREHLKRALDLYRRILGAENPKTLDTMRCLGATAQLQGKYAEAETLLNEVLHIQQRVLGPDDPDTLASMNNLASTFHFEGKYPQSEALLHQTVEIRRRVLGPEHPDTLNSMNGLATSYSVQGKYSQAETLFHQTLEIRRRVLGPEHPNTLASINNLAIIYLRQGKYMNAGALNSRNLEIRRRVQGPEHPDTLASMNNLANIYYEQGKYGQAEALYSQTVEIKRRVLGPEHPGTLSTLSNLATVYYEQGKYTRAEALFHLTLDIRRRVLGPEHPYSLSSLSDIAGMYLHQGKYHKAETFAAQSLAARRHTLGAENPDTMNTAADLALAYQSQGKFAESESLIREAIEFDRKKRPDDWQRFRAESLLGASLAGQKKYAEAEPLLVAGYKGLAARKERMGVPEYYHLERAKQWIVKLYLDWGKPEKAAAWRKPLVGPPQ